MYLVFLIFLAIGRAQGMTRSCPAAGRSATFALTTNTKVTLEKSQGSLLMCSLVLEEERDSGRYVPVARSYAKRNWEFSGGGFAARLTSAWVCQGDTCEATLPKGTYVLQTRKARDITTTERNAHFLEMASFGPTPSDIATFPRTVRQWVSDQRKEQPTYHREFYRRNANPIWRVHKFEFGAALNPCADLSSWRRSVLTVKDIGKTLQVKRVDDWWELRIEGHLRSMIPGSQFSVGKNGNGDGIDYYICGNQRNLRLGKFTLEVAGKRKPGRKCKVINTLSLDTIQFPDNFTPNQTVTGEFGRLGNSTDTWQRTSDFVPEYVKLISTQNTQCTNIPDDYSGLTAPAFIKTTSNEWLAHNPRIKMMENSLGSPSTDGGFAELSAGETQRCSNAPRTMFNEASCYMAKGQACLPGSTSKTQSFTGAVVCGSRGEVANDPLLGDSWLDVAANKNKRRGAAGLPGDKEASNMSLQREFIWSQVVMTAKDQLRQRTAWALSQIFAVPISSYELNTEYHLSYYDILVKHALGNYRDVLLETTFHPLMGLSLSLLGSQSVGAAFAKTGKLQ